MEAHQVYEPTAVIYSYGLAVLGSLAAVVVMDYRRHISNRYHQRLLLLASATALGGCGIWAMHFMGMTALQLKDPYGRPFPMSYDPIHTVGSLLAAVLFVYMGLEVATLDSYFGKDTEQRVAALQKSIGKKDLKSVKKGGKALVEYQALYAHLHWLVVGGVLAAAGVCIMHYEGMVAMRMNLQRSWKLDIIIISAVIAVTAASAAFWILFRVLEWKPHLNYLRLAAALIMGVAVCGMHYTGMYAAVYHTLPDTAPQRVIIPNGHLIAKWAVAAEVVYCVTWIFFCYAKARNGERTLTREVDKLFKSLAAASSDVEMFSTTSGGPARSPSVRSTASSIGGARLSNAEREKVLHFVSQALRFCLAHNSKKTDHDIEAVEQGILEALRGTDVHGNINSANRLGGPSAAALAALQKSKSKARLPVDDRTSDGGLNSTLGRSQNEGSFTRASDSTVVNVSMGSTLTQGPSASLSKTLEGSPPRISDGGVLRASDQSASRSFEPPSPVAPDVLPPIKGTRNPMSLSQTVTVKPKGNPGVASQDGSESAQVKLSTTGSRVRGTTAATQGADMV